MKILFWNFTDDPYHVKVFPASTGARAPSTQIPHSRVPAFPDMILPLVAQAVRYSLSNLVRRFM